jgi:hypothetical protein
MHMRRTGWVSSEWVPSGLALVLVDAFFVHSFELWLHFRFFSLVFLLYFLAMIFFFQRLVVLAMYRHRCRRLKFHAVNISQADYLRYKSKKSVALSTPWEFCPLQPPAYLVLPATDASLARHFWSLEDVQSQLLPSQAKRVYSCTPTHSTSIRPCRTVNPGIPSSNFMGCGGRRPWAIFVFPQDMAVRSVFS